jgi:hypothetical protein
MTDDASSSHIALAEGKVSNGMRKTLNELMNILQCPLCNEVRHPLILERIRVSWQTRISFVFSSEQTDFQETHNIGILRPFVLRGVHRRLRLHLQHLPRAGLPHANVHCWRAPRLFS